MVRVKGGKLHPGKIPQDHFTDSTSQLDVTRMGKIPKGKGKPYRALEPRDTTLTGRGVEVVARAEAEVKPGRIRRHPGKTTTILKLKRVRFGKNKGKEKPPKPTKEKKPKTERKPRKSVHDKTIDLVNKLEGQQKPHRVREAVHRAFSKEGREARKAKRGSSKIKSKRVGQEDTDRIMNAKRQKQMMEAHARAQMKKSHMRAMPSDELREDVDAHFDRSLSLTENNEMMDRAHRFAYED